MFAEVPQPLRYAEALLGRYAELAGAASAERLLADLVRAAAELADCALGQLYLLDHTNTRLTLSAEWLDGLLQPREAASLPSDYDGEQLLQYCLCQNQVLCIDELDRGLHSIACLPEDKGSWRSLLCLPLHDGAGHTRGLLLVASHERRTLQGFSASFTQLGGFALAQLQLLQRLRAPAAEGEGEAEAVASAPGTPCASGYGLLGQSQAMRRVYQLIGKVLHSPVSVLLTGETGTGKELVARAIHDCGARRSK